MKGKGESQFEWMAMMIYQKLASFSKDIFQLWYINSQLRYMRLWDQVPIPEIDESTTLGEWSLTP